METMVSIIGPLCGLTVMLLILYMIAVLCGSLIIMVCNLSRSLMVAIGMSVSPYNCGKPIKIPVSEYTMDLLF
jgi:hypothetical protein